MCAGAFIARRRLLPQPGRPTGIRSTVPQASGPARRGQRSVGGLRGAIPKVRQERREKPPPSSVGASVDGLMPTLAGLGFCLTESADAGAHFTWKHPGRTQDSV